MFPLEAFQHTLEKGMAILQKHSIRFHITGGVTTSTYGEPRLTQDIDIVIDNAQAAASIDDFLLSLKHSDFIHSADAIGRAIANKDMFQLIDSVESLKLDIYPRELIEGELGRSQPFEIFDGLIAPIASRADAVLSKLIWISKGSHKSRQDVRQIFRNCTKPELEFVHRLAAELKLTELLEEGLAESDEIR